MRPYDANLLQFGSKLLDIIHRNRPLIVYVLTYYYCQLHRTQCTVLREVNAIISSSISCLICNAFLLEIGPQGILFRGTYFFFIQSKYSHFYSTLASNTFHLLCIVP